MTTCTTSRSAPTHSSSPRAPAAFQVLYAAGVRHRVSAAQRSGPATARPGCVCVCSAWRTNQDWRVAFVSLWKVGLCSPAVCLRILAVQLTEQQAADGAAAKGGEGGGWFDGLAFDVDETGGRVTGRASGVKAGWRRTSRGLLLPLSSPFPPSPGLCSAACYLPMLCCAVRCVVLPPAVFACNPSQRHDDDERAKPRLFFAAFHFVETHADAPRCLPPAGFRRFGVAMTMRGGLLAIGHELS